MKRKKLIFVCSPYRSKDPIRVTRNISKAKEVCRQIALEGNVPYAPHIFATRFLDDNDKRERQIGIDIGLEMLQRCDEIYVVGEEISEGMAKEIEFAKQHNIEIKYGR